MTDVTPEKQCTICGRDCHGVPRIRDTHGRYFCAPCHSEVKRHREALMAETAVDVAAINDADSEPIEHASAERELDVADSGNFEAIPYGSMSNITADELERIRREIRDEIIRRGMSTFSPGDMHSGAAQRGGAKREEPAAEKPQAPTRGFFRRFFVPEEFETQQLDQVWPMFVGSASMIFGGGLLLVNLIFLGKFTFGLFGESDAGMSAVRIATCLPFTLLSATLLLLGRNVYYRVLRAGNQLRAWAMVAISVLVIYLAAIVIMSMQLDRAPHEISPGIDLSLFDGVTFLPATLTWFLALAFWPTFIVFWFSRTMVKRSMYGWRG